MLRGRAAAGTGPISDGRLWAQNLTKPTLSRLVFVTLWFPPAKIKRHLAACDIRRPNDLDGRGALSEEELAKFTGYFPQTCVD